MHFQQVLWLTDFGYGNPYMGQIDALMRAGASQLPVGNLISDLPAFRPDLAAYLIPHLVEALPSRMLYVCVVDPGVGSERDILAVEVGEDLFLGPDNGLLSRLMREDACRGVYRIDWPESPRSQSFHGRDVFAPLATRIVNEQSIQRSIVDPAGLVGWQWPKNLEKLIYMDCYGNLMTGISASELAKNRLLISPKGDKIGFARTFCEVAKGVCFWYENAFGLVEIAVNQGHAGEVLGLTVGDCMTIAEREDH